MLADGSVECSQPFIRLSTTPLTCNLAYMSGGGVVVCCCGGSATGRGMCNAGSPFFDQAPPLHRTSSALPLLLAAHAHYQGQQVRYKREFGEKRSDYVGAPPGLYSFGATWNVTR